MLLLVIGLCLGMIDARGLGRLAVVRLLEPEVLRLLLLLWLMVVGVEVLLLWLWVNCAM